MQVYWMESVRVMNCNNCVHGEMCANRNKMAQTDEHTWDEYELIDNVEEFCRHFKNKADVVEVKCRCKDCKHYLRYGRTSLIFEGKNIPCGWCYLQAKTDEEHRMLPFDFCSYAERRDAE